MNAKLFSSGIILTTFLFQTMAPLARAASMIDGLSKDQISRLEKGDQLVAKEKMPNSWSKLTIYQVIKGTPEEAAAVTMDWGYKVKYTQGILLKSDVSQSSFGGAVALVDYTVKVPLIGSEDFTLKNTMKTYDDGKSFEVAFHLDHAKRTKASDGTTRFESFEGNTLMEVVSQTVPPSIILGMSYAEDKAVEQTLETCNRFAKQVIDEKASDTQLLGKQIHQLEDAMTQLRSAAPSPVNP